MQDIWKLEKHCIWSGKNNGEMAKTTWRHLHWKQKEQVRLLKCIRTVCYLANFVDSLLKRMVQMVRQACWSLLSSTDPNNIGQICKLPAMYNCVKCVCICVLVSLMV